MQLCVKLLQLLVITDGVVSQFDLINRNFSNENTL